MASGQILTLRLPAVSGNDFYLIKVIDNGDGTVSLRFLEQSGSGYLSNASNITNSGGSTLKAGSTSGGITGTLTAGFIPLALTSSSLGDSLLSQTSGSITLNSGNFFLPSGNAASPSLGFSSSTTTGFYRAAADQIGISIAGTALAILAATSIQLSGSVIFSPDATYDIGASGATRPRDFFLSRDAVIGGSLTLGTPLSAANGGTGQSGYTKGDVLAASAATTLDKIAVGTDGLAFIADSAQAAGVKWGIVQAAGGGTGNAFFQVSGPATSVKTFTFPNANSTVATGSGTNNALVKFTTGASGIVGDSQVSDDGTNVTSAATQNFIGSGTALLPSLAFSAATTRGLFNDTTNTAIGFSVAATQVGFWSGSIFQLQRDGGSMDIVQFIAVTSASGNVFRWRKARGTLAAPLDVANGDSMGSFVGQAYSGGTVFGLAQITMSIDGTFTSGQRPPSNIRFFTNAANGSVTEKWRIDNAGNFLAITDNSWDIGATGATRPRTIYVGTSVITPALTVSGLTAQAFIYSGASSAISSTAAAAKGDLLTSDGSTVTKLAVGSDGQVLTADSAQTNGIKWATVATSIGGSGSANQLAFFTASTTIGGSTVLTYDDTANVKSLTLAQGSITSASPSPLLSLTSTWNNAASTFSGLKANITNTASLSGSKLFDLQVASTTRYSVGLTGNVIMTQGTISGSTITDSWSHTCTWSGSGIDFNVIKSVVTDDDSTIQTTSALLNLSTSLSRSLKFTKLGSLQIAQGSLTSSVTQQPSISITATWNDSGQTFTSIKAAITDTASNAASKMLDLQKGGTTVFAVDKIGSHEGTQTKALTETTATGYADVAVASGASIAGLVEYSVEADDGTDFQIESGAIFFSAVNKGGTVTTATSAAGVGGVQAVSAGTLTVTFDAAAGTNKTTLRCTATSSLTQTTLNIRYRVHINKGTGTVTAL